ncbi:MAG: glycosyltransferase family 4 protein [Verrucomicrobia bacterium]|nr:glycosyltransferase family 4 protein [Verrucomicrobiota bacterium]MBV8377423.1 glycosyltransferase family 4 protein [Verrucomicrobiota bacterium]
MKVLIANNMAPFVRGGAEELAYQLSARLNATPGVRSEILRVPFSWEPFERLANEIFLNRSLQLFNVDRVIALKFPAYLIPHDPKILWLLHQYRQAYDLRDRGESNIPETPRGEKILELIRRADAQAFSTCDRIFTISRVVQERLKRYNGFDSEVLMTPMNNPELFVNRGDDGYIFAGGRINSAKRQHLLVEAMAFTNSAGNLIVAGPPDTPGDADRLRDMVERLQLEDRVVLDFGFHSVGKIAYYVNHASACAYLPVDEDAVGYVTLEAVSASKPVITLRDSGGILQLIIDRETGYVVEPDAKAIADAMDSIWSDPVHSAQMGKAALHLWESLNVTWPITIEKLLS